MKKISIVLLSVMILTSCKTNYNLQGIWFGAKSIYDNDEFSKSALPLLMDFSDDSVFVQSLKRNEQERNANTHMFDYSIRKNKLVVDTVTFIIEHITSDSLHLSLAENRKVEYFFTKQEPLISPKDPGFYHHAYALTSSTVSDTIEFINDSTALSIGQRFNSGWRCSTWNIVEYKQMRFLILENMMTLYFLMKEMPDHSICLQSYFLNEKVFDCRPVITKRDTSGLAGKWANVYDETSNMPTPPTEDITYYDIKVHIQNSMVEVEKHHRKKIFSWELNSTNEIMILTSDDSSRQELWKIVEIGDDVLILEQTDLFGSEVITLYLKREVK
ncbi:MAG TPA: hypothetical protein PLA88_04015 [Bacteroidales bacterium]|nr:hypothetical protein [Bacteroidales bacterium]